MFLYDLKENYCPKDARLEVKPLPKSLKLEHRQRSVQQVEPGKLEHFVCVTRELMQKVVKCASEDHTSVWVFHEC